MEKVQQKRKNRQYSQKQVEDAILAVKNNSKTSWIAAKHFKIPYQTLKDRLEKRYETNQIGARSILSLDDEKELVSWIQERAKLGYPMDKLELNDAAAKVAERRGMKNFGEKGLSSSR